MQLETVADAFATHVKSDFKKGSFEVNLQLVQDLAEQGIAEEEALKKGMEEKSKEFAEKGNELYAKA